MAATCTDMVKNGSETDVDCGGGVCAACADGKQCSGATDCASGVCGGGLCAAPSCTDKVKNGAETDVDCGGKKCSACGHGKKCTLSADCVSGVCGASGVCAAPSCTDKVKNGGETDVDCGGSCAGCAAGKKCSLAKDCASLVCTGGLCLTSSCTDKVQNGTETDTDCGGSCPAKCAVGAKCKVSTDCSKAVCGSNSTCRLAISCKELHAAQAKLASGVYSIDPDGAGTVAAFKATCDMTGDGGGWMLVTAAMISSQVKNNATVVNSADTAGGLIQVNYANAPGCGNPKYSSALALIKDTVPWTAIRYAIQFRGSNSCWGIFGGTCYTHKNAIANNLKPFEAKADTIRDQQKMGGSKGNAFDGKTCRCDNTTVNFWHSNNGNGLRSAAVILRRDTTKKGLAGLGLGVSCTNSNAGTASPTNWRYSKIYIR